MSQVALMISTPHQYYSSDQIKNNEIGGVCSTNEGDEMCPQGFSRET